MTLEARDKLSTILAKGDWRTATAFLSQLDPAIAADLLLELPFDQQSALFQHLPLPFAAALAEGLPNYDAYALIRTRPPQELRAILDHMQPAELVRFLDELPEQSLEDELAVQGPSQAALPWPAAAPEPIVQAVQVEKVFNRPGGGRVQVIAPTDLSIEPGMIIALLGPSGSGKSTLMRMLAGLSLPSAGHVLWHGRSIQECAPNVAIVFQSFALFPWLTVVENVEVPLIARAIGREERRHRALAMLESVGLKGFENAYPKELSGGMKQRVGFARALAVEPEILFMDEPFSALDVLTAENLRGELMELWSGRKIPTKSIFLVTHNIEEAVLLADRVLVLERNPARIRADFRVALSQPRARNSAEFLVYVDYIYKLLTRPQLEARPPWISLPDGEKAPVQMLPDTRPGAIGGLLELLNDRGGTVDLYQIADDLRMEVDDLLPIVEAAGILGFSRSVSGDVEITPQGKAFAEADIGARKGLFQQAVLAHVALLRQMSSALHQKSDRTMPLEFFRDILRQHFSDQEAGRQIETALNWGLYADLFTYDSETGRIVSYDAEASGKEAGDRESRA
jgi:NitT/TauT family transport system ATP-binding protein